MGAGASGQAPTRRFSGPFWAGLASLVFYAALLAVPLLGAFLGLMSALPLVREQALGRTPFLAWGWVLVVLAGAALAAGGESLGLLAAGYLLVAVWPAVTVELWQRRGWSSGRWLAVLTLGAWGFASALAMGWFGAAHVGELLAKGAVAWVEAHQEAVRFWSFGQTELVVDGASLAGYLVPAIAATYVMAAGLWLRPRLGLLGFSLGREPFASYASEEWLPFGFVVGGFGWAFASGVWGWLAANLLAVVVALYFVHGAAIILAVLGPKVGANRWVRAAVVVLGVQVPLLFFYAALGLVDSFVKLRRAKEDEGSEL
jgi:hypothetical protein